MADSCNMEIFFSFILFPYFTRLKAREILRKQKELEKYFSYCILHHAITNTYCNANISLRYIWADTESHKVTLEFAHLGHILFAFISGQCM